MQADMAFGPRALLFGRFPPLTGFRAVDAGGERAPTRFLPALFYPEVPEQNFLRLGIPQPVMGLAAVGQSGKQRVGPPLLPEVLNGGEGHVELGIGQLLPAGNLGQARGGLRDGVNAADVGDHHAGRIPPWAARRMASFRSSVLPPVVPMIWVEV